MLRRTPSFAWFDARVQESITRSLRPIRNIVRFARTLRRKQLKLLLFQFDEARKPSRLILSKESGFTWITPLEAKTSAFTTVASLTI